jgi:hypothetical protein
MRFNEKQKLEHFDIALYLLTCDNIYYILLDGYPLLPHPHIGFTKPMSSRGALGFLVVKGANCEELGALEGRSEHAPNHWNPTTTTCLYAGL